MGVVGAVVAYAILTVVPSPVLPAASQALAAACVPLAMVLGVRRPDPRGGAAVAASLAVTVVAAFLAAVAYIVIISLVTRATGRPTLIVEEAVVILLCAACLDLVRRLLQGKVDQRLVSAFTGPPDDGRVTMPGGGTGVVIRMATGDDTGRSGGTVHECLDEGWPESPGAPTP